MTNKDIDDIYLYNRLQMTCTTFPAIFRKFSFLCTKETIIVKYCLTYEKRRKNSFIQININANVRAYSAAFQLSLSDKLCLISDICTSCVKLTININ